MTSAFVFIKNRLVPAAEAVVPSACRSFRFGDGLFTTIALHRGKPYQWRWHLEQLRAGLAALRIPAHLEELSKHCQALLLANQAETGLLRISISRGGASQGYLPAQPDAEPLLVIETLPARPAPPSPVALWISSYEKISPRALPVQHKLAQGLNATLARMEAQSHDCQEALQCNAKGELCEASAANLFWYHAGKLYTPAPACGLYPGSTRAAILRFTPYPVEEGHYPMASLEKADTIFLTNASHGIVPVIRLEPAGYHWSNFALAEELNALLMRDIEADTGLAEFP